MKSWFKKTFQTITAKKYLEVAQRLMDAGIQTDGCTSPFKTYIHRWLNKARLICAAHDYGGRNMIVGVRPGWHNNVHFLKANWHCGNYVWGVISFLATLPYAVVYYDLNIKIGMVVFYIFIPFACLVSYLAYLKYFL